VLLLVLAGGVAALVGTWPRAGDRAPLLAVLAAGQLLGHLILDVGMHHPAAAGVMPSVAMALAHVIAVLLGALLIAGSDRLYRAVSSVIKRCWRTPSLPVGVRQPTVALRIEPPAQRLLMLATSISHRGPPAFAR
jgi:hypothetical protein